MTPREALAIYAWNVLRSRRLAHENTLVLREAGLVEYARRFDACGRFIGAWDEPTEAGKKAGLK